ncbi:hypothetical protein [Caldimonas brevitalea]|uniref:Type II and III secretion system family protein n=1 Tax=Caldimonas brevitalea TaxID=413882 RepID=A0A0G3BQE1_9BURK|nr:hypothetical protein [Caldimonas brevitalea]AKJ31644.1 type II and III secretion system family protein [Caldimonas brevitalea]
MIPTFLVRRGLVLAVCALAAGAAPAQSAADLPQRNLRIEVRQGDEAELTQQGLGAGGEVTVSTSRRVEGGVTVQTTRRETRRSGQAAQQVLVLNGGRAGVRLGQSQPLQLYQVAWSPGTGPQLMPTTVIVEAGRGFSVSPRWPGGNAPVLVEIEAESSRLDTAAAREGGTALTTVQVPLDEWVTIASSGDTEQRDVRGVLSSRQASGSRRQLVQLRVSAP